MRKRKQFLKRVAVIGCSALVTASVLPSAVFADDMVSVEESAQAAAQTEIAAFSDANAQLLADYADVEQMRVVTPGPLAQPETNGAQDALAAEDSIFPEGEHLNQQHSSEYEKLPVSEQLESAADKAAEEQTEEAAEEETKEEVKESASSGSPEIGKILASFEPTGDIIKDFINALVAMANDDRIGYNNLTPGYQAYYGHPDLDCGYFVSRGLQQVGLFDAASDQRYEPNDAYGGSGFSWYNTLFTAAGFTGYDYDGPEWLQLGDILIDDCHHTEVYIGDGKLVGAHGTMGYPQPGDQTGGEVSVTGFFDDGWEYVYRYHGEASSKLIKKIITDRAVYPESEEPVEPSATVLYNGKTLREGTDYTLSYENNTEVGMATAIATLQGDYHGEIREQFPIVPKSTSVSSIVPDKKSFVVIWNEAEEQVEGYELEYCSNSRFDQPHKVVIDARDTVSYRVKDVSAHKNYYVRVRTMTTMDGEPFYSEWSSVDLVKTR